MAILNAIKEVDPQYALGYSTVCRRVQDFRKGRSDLSLKHNSGRHLSATDEINTEKVASVLQNDRRITCDEIAHEVGISHGSVYTILTRRLHMRKIAARWVPHFLSQTEKDRRVEISQELLSRFTD